MSSPNDTNTNALNTPQHTANLPSSPRSPSQSSSAVPNDPIASSTPPQTQSSSSPHSSQPANSGPPPANNEPPPSLPSMPWHGPFPSFFMRGPDGQMTPHFPSPTPPGGAGGPGGAGETVDPFRPLIEGMMGGLFNRIRQESPTVPRPENDGASSDASTTNNAPNDATQSNAAPAEPARAAPPTNAGQIPAGNTFTPPRLPHPFFSFVMPIFGGPSRSRQPDPEAAAELLRSLPSVSKPLFRRVNRITIAEQIQDGEEEDDKGWKCGVCLEGVQEDEKETGVKVLPCNHLFHGDCLEPWFTTNHTCPTCRLDLDPGRTLRSSRRRPAGRPGFTGSGRQTPHPYNRDPSTNGAESQTPQIPSVGIQPSGGEANHMPDVTFIWRMPTPPPNPAAELPTTPEPAAPAQEQTGTPPPPPTGDAPTLHFDINLTASPTPMHQDRAATASPAPAPVGQQSAEGSSQTVNANTDQQESQNRSHFTILHHHHPSSPHHHHHHRIGSPHVHLPHHIHQFPFPHHHHVRSSSQPPVPPSNATSEPTTEPSSQAAPAASVTVPITTSDDIVPNGATNDPEGSTTTAGGTTPAPSDTAGAARSDSGARNNGHSAPHFHVFFNFSDGPPPFPPMPVDTPTEQAPAEPTPPIERPTLEAWATSRERQLGWRCDAVECELAPTDDDDEDAPMPMEGEKEMISIYSELQPAVMTEQEAMNAQFELHACEHRWHRTCLETMERAAGRGGAADEEGRVWVRCERCRKRGWIRSRERSLSEGEVERLIVA